MKRWVKKGTLFKELFVLLFSVNLTFAGPLDDRPAHKGYPDAAPDVARPMFMGCGDLLTHTSRYLDPFSQAKMGAVNRDFRSAVALARRIAFRRELAKFRMLKLPEVTQADVDYLGTVGAKTSINRPTLAFTISETPVTVGLYHAVMLRYPRLGPGLRPRSFEEKFALRQRWLAHPDLPLTNTTLAEDQEFVERLNAMTGRHFRIPSGAEAEYAIRGRVKNDRGEFEDIVITAYPWGSDRGDFERRAWVCGNSGLQPHEVREPLPGLSIDESKNSFGLIHPVGNIRIRSLDGIIRGGSFRDCAWGAVSAVRVVGVDDQRMDSIGLRLAE